MVLEIIYLIGKEGTYHPHTELFKVYILPIYPRGLIDNKELGYMSKDVYFKGSA